MKILYKNMYKNMSNVLLDRFFNKLAEQTFLEQSDFEIQTD